MANGFQWESDPENEESESYETDSPSTEMSAEQQTEAPFNETEEMELAAELLSIANEEELEQFLGGLIKRAGSAVGSFVRSPVGQALGGVLKDAARQALPIVGGAIGTAIGGQSGGRVGQQLASHAGRVFGLELEGLSGEDQEFEVARRFVRFAGAAAGRAAVAPRGGAPRQTAHAAALGAARRYAPGLLRGAGRRGFRSRRALRSMRGGGFSDPGLFTTADSGFGATEPDFDDADQNNGTTTAFGRRHTGGRWLRRGRQIIIFNC